MYGSGQYSLAMYSMFLIIVDAHSKWPEVIPMTTTSAARIIGELRKLFPTHGLPEQQMNFGLS